MENKQPPSNPQSFYPAQQPTQINLPGDNNSVYAHVDTVSNEYNSTVYVVGNQPPISKQKSPQPITINADYYNLIVVAEGDLNETNYVMVDKTKAITESTERELKNSYANLRPEAIAELKTFPTIIATENHQYGNTDEQHFAIYGMITDIKIQDNGIKVYYHKFHWIQQQRLNGLLEELGIERASCCNELDHLHWSVKRINVQKVLQNNGVQFWL